MQKIKIPWSDNWWIENEKAWFCAGEIGALFCADMVKLNCEFVARIPECDAVHFRRYSYCVKHRNEIYCLPVEGSIISYYNIESKQWKKIDINSKKSIWISIASYNPDYDIIWLVEDVTGKIFEINLNKNTVENEYQIPNDEKAIVGEYAAVEDKIYGVIGNHVYCIGQGGINIYDIPEVKAGLYTICYDGYNFWLSGYCKEIYVWNPEQGIIKVISEFPGQFGFYHFDSKENHIVDRNSFFSVEYAFFIDSISLGKYIWFIPFRSDEIVYVEKETYEVHLLEVKEETETKESIERHILDHKYLVQYMRENRYIGIYSLRNGSIFEIDTVSLCMKKQDYALSDKAIGSIAREILKDQNKNQKVYKEKREYDQELLLEMLFEIDHEKTESRLHNVGSVIYHTLNEPDKC